MPRMLWDLARGTAAGSIVLRLEGFFVLGFVAGTAASCPYRSSDPCSSLWARHSTPLGGSLKHHCALTSASEDREEELGQLILDVAH